MTPKKMKTTDLSFEEVSDRLCRTIQEEGIDVEKLVDEATTWARKTKKPSKSRVQA